ncbi:unnamed protein product [Didymodactylos carnosus]|uniref:Uncharacterized protein n=1 Tax=Didymodactylos carnosus TaxID=1234261 RepID=A0A815KVF6_9BILA|nr:unnamed protein product [Didymodactylos carnosus]CAF4294694.1 unnamed protein product [Didymodactylos carnosus]
MGFNLFIADETKLIHYPLIVAGESDEQKWRWLTKPGLCLKGKCSNSSCEAHNQMVIMNMGICVFNVITDVSEGTIKCPVCDTFVHPLTCAFYNCEWRWDGLKKSDMINEPPLKVNKTEYASVTNEYHLFDIKGKGEAAMVNWLQLIIHTRPMLILSNVQSVCFPFQAKIK